MGVTEIEEERDLCPGSKFIQLQFVQSTMAGRVQVVILPKQTRVVVVVVMHPSSSTSSVLSNRDGCKFSGGIVLDEWAVAAAQIALRMDLHLDHWNKVKTSSEFKLCDGTGGLIVRCEWETKTTDRRVLLNV